MELILKTDIKGLGFKNDLVIVKPGYGRNYLIPQGLAIVANPSNKKSVAEEQRQKAHKADKIRKDAQNIADGIEQIVLNIAAKVGESGKIFGAVTTLQISDALKTKGFDIDRRKIAFESDVKSLGEYLAVIDLHKDVQQKVKFVVVAG